MGLPGAKSEKTGYHATHDHETAQDAGGRAMCRLAAYLGTEIALERFLLKPEHSLVVQSWAPKELKYAKLNADGFGFAWYGPDDQPACYVNDMPIWSDVNLGPLGRTLIGDLWVASIRSATSGFASGAANTQPFCDEDFIFTHNGYIGHFAERVRQAMCEFIAPPVLATVRGNTDSEYIFALIRHLLIEDEELALESAIGEAFSLLEDWADGEPALLNIVMSDGERVYASRHAFNHESPSLYYTTDDESFPDDAQLIASEALTATGLWQPVPDHHILILDPEEPPELLAL